MTILNLNPLPEEGSRLNAEEAMVIWITALQTRHLYNGLPRLRVMGYEGNEEEYSDVDLLNDDATNLLNETWMHPVYYPFDQEEEEDEQQ